MCCTNAKGTSLSEERFKRFCVTFEHHRLSKILGLVYCCKQTVILNQTRDAHHDSKIIRIDVSSSSSSPRMDDSGKAVLRSQGGPGAGLALSTCPVSRLTSFTPQMFRVILLRRLHLPLPLTRAQLPVWPSKSTLVAITEQLVHDLGVGGECCSTNLP